MKISTYFLLILTYCLSSFSHSKLTILSPQSLASRFDSKGGLDYRVVDFANFPFGSQVVGKLVVSNPIDACSSVQSFAKGEKVGDVLAIVTRGGCRETIKAINIEQAGGRVMLLVNDNDILPEFIHGMQSSQQTNIPTVLITRTDGDKIIESLQNGENNEVYVSISFPSDNKRRTVNVDFWFSTSDTYRIAAEFLTHLNRILRDYDDVFIFNPHYVTWTCGKCKLDKFTYSDVDCISGGRYCAPDPDDTGPLTGKDIIMEDLRQMCLWRMSHDLWWEYVLSFEKKCLKKDDIKRCSTDLLNRLASPNELLELANCVTGSFIPDPKRGGVVNEDLDDNKLMQAEKKDQEDFDVTHFPILYINYKKYHGRVSHVRRVYKELCEKLSTPVESCIDLLESTDRGARSYRMQRAIKDVSIFVLIASFFGLIACWYYRRAGKKERQYMSMEASSMVHDYFALQDNDPLEEKS